MTTQNKYLGVNFYIILIGISLTTFSIADLSNICNSKLNCADCIQTVNCSWCTNENFSNKSRCNQIGLNQYNLCTKNFTINPNSTSTILQNDELTRIKLLKNKKLKDNENPKIVQIKPQYISLKLKPNDVYKIYFKYSKAEDYPLDLYYLMDLSSSMGIHKTTLSSLVKKFGLEMRKITRNFRLGFGSFVDKVILPFTATSKEKLKNPCLEKKPCDSPYSYKHHMSLSDNENLFSQEVNAANISSNIDTAEGGFDALMQSMVCQKLIGWRKNARRLIVFSTDAPFHLAGDGKLAGIIEPNDGKCHMENNKYTHAEILDYPSVFHLNEVAKNNSINMIFAVTKSVAKLYKNLATRIQGATAGIINQKSDNVVDLIKNQYNQITESIEIKDNAHQQINVRFFTACLDPSGNKIEQSKCNNLKDDSVIEFEARISFSECPTKKEDWKQTFDIYPVGIDESLTIKLEMICDCDCKNSGHLYEKYSEKCNEHGTYECGVCKCDEGYFGKKCECLRNITDSSESASKNCKKNENDLIVCSGRGSCRCGECECNKPRDSEGSYSGRFCECDNFSCPRPKNLLCSGEHHGTCKCGECVCKSGWKGSSCDCSTSEKTCYPSSDEAICSGHGICECGKCICNDPYDGNYCEICSTCEKRCKNIEHCVECKIYNTGPLKNECSKNCTGFQITTVDNIEESDDKEDWQFCKSVDEETNCEFIFEYKNYNQYDIRAKKEKICPDKDSALKIIAYVIGAILALGIFTLLLWKLIIAIHDKREYSKFEEEKLTSKWDEADNPLYKEATSLYKNPGFYH